MFKFLAMAIAAWLFAPDAEAALFKIEFEATGLGNNVSRVSDPLRRVARGSVTWEAQAALGRIDRLVDFQLEFGEERFRLRDVGFMASHTRLILFGHHHDSALEGSGRADDFIISIDRNSLSIAAFQVTMEGTRGVWADLRTWGYDGRTSARFVDANAKNEVSEPGTLALALVGFGALALAMRRRAHSAPRIA